jgi:hypothetical protein
MGYDGGPRREDRLRKTGRAGEKKGNKKREEEWADWVIWPNMLFSGFKFFTIFLV